MIELNKIAFIDEDGFDFNDGESLIRFDTVAYYPDRNEIIYAITNNGKISVITYDVFEDDKGHYIEYGNTLIKIYISEFALLCKISLKTANFLHFVVF